MRTLLRRSTSLAFLLAAALSLMTAQIARGQTPLDWDHAKCFEYVIDKISYAGGSMTVLFRVTNPLASASGAPCGIKPFWKIVADAAGPADPEFSQPAGGSSLVIDIGWLAKDYTNAASQYTLAALPQGGGRGTAYPVRINALTGVEKAVPVGGSIPGQYKITKALPNFLDVKGSGAVGIESHPAWFNGTAWIRVPVKSAVDYFTISTPAETRRKVVDIANCMRCHNDATKDGAGVPIPRLSLHGNNRNENLELCAICHNPYQTDIPYRTTGAEVSVDFKSMVHSIHAAKMRKTPFQVIGFQGAVNDYSSVRFPAKLSNCLNCHIDVGGKGTFEIPPTSPVATYVAGTTIESGSTPGCWQPDPTPGCAAGTRGTVDLDPTNDYKITPIAAACSACHDDRETREHMISKGASFRIRQADIHYWNGSTVGTERCPACHGPGKEEDVRKAHEIRGVNRSHD